MSLRLWDAARFGNRISVLFPTERLWSVTYMLNLNAELFWLGYLIWLDVLVCAFHSGKPVQLSHLSAIARRISSQRACDTSANATDCSEDASEYLMNKHICTSLKAFYWLRELHCCGGDIGADKRRRQSAQYQPLSGYLPHLPETHIRWAALQLRNITKLLRIVECFYCSSDGHRIFRNDMISFNWNSVYCFHVGWPREAIWCTGITEVIIAQAVEGMNTGGFPSWSSAGVVNCPMDVRCLSALH